MKKEISTSKPKILCAVPIVSFRDAYNCLNDSAETKFMEYPPYEEVLSVISQFDGLFPNAKMKVDENLLSKTQRLKAISIPAMGTDNIDLKACRARGIKVFSLSDAKDFMSRIPSTAEYTLALILSLLKKIYCSTNSVLVDGKWVTSEFRGFDLHKKKVGIIGYGVVGRKLASLLYAFGVEIFAHDAYASIEDPNVTVTDMKSLLKESDIVSVHVPLTKETVGLIGKEQFALMNDTYFINCARGEVIDDLALIEALESKKVRAAALDVITGEANIDFLANPLIQYARRHDNLLITPHCAGSSNDALKQTFLYSAKKLITYLNTL